MSLAEEINELLYEVDPVGLRAGGCPKDEYSREASDLATRVTALMGTLEIERAVHDVFLKAFGERICTSLNSCGLLGDIAQKIYEMLDYKIS